MKKISIILFTLLSSYYLMGQILPPKQAYPINVKQIHSGHSLTDPLFGQPWPGQFVNLVASENGQEGWALFNVMIGKSTAPGSSLAFRWNDSIGYGDPDARLNIADWELLCITERVPLLYEGGNTQQWYLDGIQEQRDYLSLFVNNAWTYGNNGNGTPTLFWTTWTNIDDSDGPWRQMLDVQGEEFERMQDYANLNRPTGAPPVYLIPGHKMMARLYDDIQLNIVPDITTIDEFFIDNIHTNSLGAYAIAMIHYACIFNESPVGLSNDLMPNPPTEFQMPSEALALYLQTMIWEEVTAYSERTGISDPSTGVANVFTKKEVSVYPNPTDDFLYINSSSDNTTVSIVNSVGRIVYEGNEQKIDVSEFPSGIYFLKKDNFNEKFVKK